MYLLIYLLTHSFKWYASQCWSVAEVEAPILWPPDMKSQLIGKDPDAGKDLESKRRREGTEDERIKWHHRLNGREFEQTPKMVKEREAWHAAVHGVMKSQGQLSNWTTITSQRYLVGKWAQWWSPCISIGISLCLLKCISLYYKITLWRIF